MKKRILIALFAGATVFGSALAFAASLTLDSGDLAAGDAAVGSCDSTVSTRYGAVEFDDTLLPEAAYVVGTVIVGDIDPICDGRTVGVTLTDSVGDVIVSDEAVYLSANGTSVTVSLPADTRVDAVARVNAVVYSASA